MVRPRSPAFVPRMLAAAARVFARTGLKQARMTDIAREMGVAHGSLYNYVESKEALFLLLVEQWGRPELKIDDRELPLRTPPIADIVEQLRRRVQDTFPLPSLDAALKRRRVADAAAELRGIVLELFVQTERSREGATILERSARDVPELFGLFFEQVRRDLFARLTRYVATRMTTGDFHPADPPTAARFIIESVTFFARHRFQDPHPQDLEDDAVRETIVDLVTRSLITPTRRTGSKPPAARSAKRRT
ncbi:MAG TPA: helix-turn-helix domain-containing protein [Vicinamibacterales bacterium]|nr:helix-turn-helix domain-containing protein [Vicinamibacterales bacterium]